LIESSHPEQEERLPPAIVNLDTPINSWLIQQLATTGIFRLLNNFSTANTKQIPPEILPKSKAFTPQSISAVLAEGKFVGSNLLQAQQLSSLGDRPLVVLTSAKPKNPDEYPAGLTKENVQQAEAVWQELQAELVNLSSRSQHIISKDSGHLMYFDQPELIINAICHVVNQVQQD